MLKGIDINETVEYVASGDKENPTKFLVGNISNRNKIKLFADAIDKTGQVDLVKIQDRAIDIFKIGVKGIRNLGGVDYDVVNDDVVEKISLVTILEVVSKVLEFNFAGEEEIKN